MLPTFFSSLLTMIKTYGNQSRSRNCQNGIKTPKICQDIVNGKLIPPKSYLYITHYFHAFT